MLPSPEALEEQDALLRYLGCDAAHAKLPAQRIADAVAVRMALQHRHTIRGTYRLNAGFGPSEVRSYRRPVGARAWTGSDKCSTSPRKIRIVGAAEAGEGPLRDVLRKHDVAVHLVGRIPGEA